MRKYFVLLVGLLLMQATSFAQIGGYINAGTFRIDSSTIKKDGNGRLYSTGTFNTSLSVGGTINLTGNTIQTSAGDLNLKISSSNYAFRAVRAGGWSDAASSIFFQLGEVSENAWFTSRMGGIFGRFGISASNMTFTDVSYDKPANVPSALVNISSTAKGFLLPRMSNAQRLAISSPANGLLTYERSGSTRGYYWYDSVSAAWQQLTAPIATSATLGIIKPGASLSIAADGTLDAKPAEVYTDDDGSGGGTIAGNGTSGSPFSVNTVTEKVRILATTLTGYVMASSRTAITSSMSILQAMNQIGKYLADLAAIAFTGSATDLSTGTVPVARLPTSGATPGSYTASNITIDVYGRITSASNGTATGGASYSNVSFTFPSSTTANSDGFLIRNAPDYQFTGFNAMYVEPTGSGNRLYLGNNNTGKTFGKLNLAGISGIESMPSFYGPNFESFGNDDSFSIFRSGTTLNFNAISPGTGTSNGFKWWGTNLASPAYGGTSSGSLYMVLQEGKLGIASTSPTSRLDVVGANGYSQMRLRTTYTPTGSADANGNTGDWAWDANFVYVKTGAGWKRTTLSTF